MRACVTHPIVGRMRQDGWMDGCVFRAVDVAVVCREVPFPPFLFLGGVVFSACVVCCIVLLFARSFVVFRLFVAGFSSWAMFLLPIHGGCRCFLLATMDAEVR